MVAAGRGDMRVGSGRAATKASMRRWASGGGDQFGDARAGRMRSSQRLARFQERVGGGFHHRREHSLLAESGFMGPWGSAKRALEKRGFVAGGCGEHGTWGRSWPILWQREPGRAGGGDLPPLATSFVSTELRRSLYRADPNRVVFGMIYLLADYNLEG